MVSRAPASAVDRSLTKPHDHSSAQIKLNFWNQLFKPNIH
jgi:hypothetical protein